MENKRKRTEQQGPDRIINPGFPESLLSQCISYVANNLDYVESFIGLPDLIGEQIFKEAEKQNKFDVNSDSCIHNLSLFVFAYGELVLSSLNLSCQYLGLNYCQDHIQICTFLKDLDLCGCKLDDDHDFLTHVGQLECLENLSLRRNGLSDLGIQRLTASYRVRNRGPKNLQRLDLSENWDITVKSEKYFKQFMKLCEVDVTGTQFKGNSDLLKHWKFKPFKESIECSSIQNSGWASDVVDKWMKAAIDRISTIKVKKDLTKTLKFYAVKRTCIPKTLEEESSEKVNHVQGYRLKLIRINSGNEHVKSVDQVMQNHTSKPSQNKTSIKDSCNISSEKSTLRTKVQSSLEQGDDIVDLVAQYGGCAVMEDTGNNLTLRSALESGAL